MDRDIYGYVIKLPKQHFNVRLFSNPGDTYLVLVDIYEARISEWNIGTVFMHVPMAWYTGNSKMCTLRS